MNKSNAMKTLATTIDLLLIKAFMKATPQEWMEEHENAIEIKIRCPKRVIEALHATKIKFKQTGFFNKIEFNDLITDFITHLIIEGLTKRAEKLPEDYELLTKQIKNIGGLK